MFNKQNDLNQLVIHISNRFLKIKINIPKKNKLVLMKNKKITFHPDKAKYLMMIFIFSGEHFTTSFRLGGDGWVELDRSVLEDVGDETEVEMTVVTSSRNGILMWHGQDPRTAGGVTDFFSIGGKHITVP